MENLNSYQFATLSDISNLSFLFNLVCTPCTLNFQIEYVRNLVVDAIDSLHTDNHEALQQIEQKCHCHDDKDADIHPEDDLS